MNDEELRKEVANKILLYATPIDFAQLIKDGVLKQIGKSYYADNIHKLPDDVIQKIKSVTPTKNGAKLTFCKVTKSIKEIAEKLRENGY
jgi:hypothetical protein